MDPAETAEPIEVPFAGQTLVGSRNLYYIPSERSTLADLGFFRPGDFGNPSERSERALRGLGLRENEI